MQELYKKLKKYSLKDAIQFEEDDRQFLALKKLWNSFTSPPNPLSFAGEGEIRSYYLFLIIANALVCYQLSWKGEDYWEEFSDFFSVEKGINYKNINILRIFEEFLNNCKNNKRFTKVKLKRIEKILVFFDKFTWKQEYYYENMLFLRDELAKIMNQKYDAKTIVFAVKMFSYWARCCFWKIIYFPDSITIPIDSRLIKIFERYSPHSSPLPKGEGIKQFYSDLSKKLEIPQLHLDAILWNSKDLI